MSLFAAIASEPARSAKTIVKKMTMPGITSLPKHHSSSHISPKFKKEVNVTALDLFKAKAHAVARSGYFYGLPLLEFELSFQDGFKEAREWLDLASTKEELERLCQESRAQKAA
jgi:hypothetical protein